MLLTGEIAVISGGASPPGTGHIGLARDVTDTVAGRTAIHAVPEAFGRTEVLVDNAGIPQPSKVLDIAPESDDAVMGASLRAGADMDLNGGMWILAPRYRSSLERRSMTPIRCTRTIPQGRHGDRLPATQPRP